MAILTALVLLITAGSVSAGQTHEQEITASQLVHRYVAALKRGDRWLAIIGKKQKCPDAEKAIVYYRQKVWSYQDELGESRNPTRYPERKRNACPYKKWVSKNWQGISREYRKQIDLFNRDRAAAICYIFGEHCKEAIAVAKCESGHAMSINAKNGQYLGLFQMGEYARGRYGHSNTAIGQARSAHRYFVESGKDWSPWSCKPWGK